MSVTSEQAATYESAPAARHTRIDAAHAAETSGESTSSEAARLGGALLEVATGPSSDLIAAVAGQTLESRREQLQLQVSQLAGHLRERLQEVDRREAAVNARASQLEADLRASRLWLREREHSFQEREAELRRQIAELQDRIAPRARGDESESQGAPCDTLQQELIERQQELQLRESEVRDRRFELERQASALRHSQQLLEQDRSRLERSLAQQRETLELEFRERVAARENDFKTAESLLAEHAARIDQDRVALAADRQQWAEHKSHQQRALQQQQEAAQAESCDMQQRLAARQDWIERQKAGLEEVRSEVLALHRQSLEMRLAAEQLWSQITGRASPAEVTHAVAQLRLKLAEQYRLEEQNLQAHREELVALGERIAAQHGELKQLQAGLRQWAATRQAEIEEQAASLVQRELALDEQQEQARQAEHKSQSYRRSLEQKIRELTSQLRTAPAA